MAAKTFLTNSLAILGLLFVLGASAIAGGRIIYVDDDGPADFRNIQAAIDAAVDGDIVVVGPGKYTGDGNRDIVFKGKAITVRSIEPNDPNIVAATIIDCNATEEQPHRGFNFYSGEGNSSVLAGFKIINGYGPDAKIWNDSSSMRSAGGAIFCENSSPKICNCILHGNIAHFGAAVFCKHSNASLNNCTIKSNKTSCLGVIFCYYSSPIISNSSILDNGGTAISCYHDCMPVIENCCILNNGSGIECKYNCSPTIVGSSIGGNSGVGIQGEGDLWRNCKVTVSKCIISDNGIGLSFRYRGSAIISNCTIIDNEIRGIFGYGSYRSITIINSTFSGNGDGSEGAALYTWSGCSISISNSIFWGNKGLPIRIGSRVSLSVSYSDVEGGSPHLYIPSDCQLNWGQGNIDTDPLFDNYYHLSAFSPCVNTGDPAYSPQPGQSDIDGDPRVINARIDMGSDEFDYEGPFIFVSPPRLEVSLPQGSDPTETDIVYIQNIGLGTMNWLITEDCPWIQVSPISGRSSGEIDEVTLSADVSSIKAGSYSCELMVISEDAINSPQKLELILRVIDEDGMLYVPSEYPTIQAAIDCADGDRGDTVIVADGIYTGNGNRDVDFKGKTVTVRSQNGPDNCIIDCNGTEENPHRGFDFNNNEDANSVIDGFTIRNGYASDYWPENCGGGIRCYGGSPKIVNCIIIGCSAKEGGGISCQHTPGPEIKNCLVRGNIAEYGGGICSWYSSPVVTNCTIRNNQGKYGGGLYCGRNKPTISNCIIAANKYSGEFSVGQFHGGAGIFCYSTKLQISNCSITGNNTNGYGGGFLIEDDESKVVITNCTISGNIGDRGGGGISVYFDATASVLNSIVWGNQAKEEPEIDFWQDYSFVHVRYSDIKGGWSGQGNINDDPCFILPGYWFDPTLMGDSVDDIWVDGDYRLQFASPCIDRGHNEEVPPELITDLDGNPRIINDRVDMGAYEGPRQKALLFFLSTELVNVPEGGTATFTVSLVSDPNGPRQVTVAHYWGDPDITVESGASLTFDSSNYFQPQTVTLAAAEDADYINGKVVVWVDAPQFVPSVVVATEEENEPIPTVVYVDADVNNTGANQGTRWADAFTDLQQALDFAVVVPQIEEIRVAQGIYKPSKTGDDREAAFQLVNGVALKGGYAGFSEPNPKARDIDKYETILSGDLNGDDAEVADPCDLLTEQTRSENSYHVVTGSGTDETAVLDGFIITAGNANGYYRDWQTVGAGLYCGFNSRPTISNCKFVSNSAEGAGGMIYGCDGSISESIISGNAGGGISCCDGTITNCTINGNYGGGMGWCNGEILKCTISGNNGSGMRYCYGLVSNCTIRGNASDFGGAMYCCEGHITNCIISDNSAKYDGGGIYCYEYDPVITNCVLSGNTAGDRGGAIYAYYWYGSYTTLIVNNCTITGNSAYEVGGIYADLEYPPIVQNSIFWFNTDSFGTDESAQIFVYSYDEIINYCCIQGWTGALGGVGNIDADPCFVDSGYWNANGLWVNGDYHLLPDSPCINTGDPDYVCEPDETDLDGNPRISRGRIDMGAYEYRPPILPTVRIVPRVINLTSKGKWINCYIFLAVDCESILLEDEIEPESIWFDQEKQVAVARFSRSEVQVILTVGQNELTISGRLTDGTYFEATDVIKVADKGGGKSAK